MALYTGNSKKVKIIFKNKKYHLNLYSNYPIVNGIKLFDSENALLKDSRGIYLTAKEEE